MPSYKTEQTVFLDFVTDARKRLSEPPILQTDVCFLWGPWERREAGQAHRLQLSGTPDAMSPAEGLHSLFLLPWGQVPTLGAPMSSTAGLLSSHLPQAPGVSQG